MGLRPVAACGTSPPPGGAGLLLALCGASVQGPLPTAVEADYNNNDDLQASTNPRWRTALRRSHSADRSCGVRAPRRRARARQVSDGKRNPPCSRTPCRAHRKRTLGRCATSTTSSRSQTTSRQPRRKGTRSAAARRRHRGAYCCTTVTRRCTRSRRQHDRCTPSTRTKGSVGLRESSRVDGGPVGAGLDARGYRLR